MVPLSILLILIGLAGGVIGIVGLVRGTVGALWIRDRVTAMILALTGLAVYVFGVGAFIYRDGTPSGEDFVAATAIAGAVAAGLVLISGLLSNLSLGDDVDETPNPPAPARVPRVSAAKTAMAPARAQVAVAPAPSRAVEAFSGPLGQKQVNLYAVIGLLAGLLGLFPIAIVFGLIALTYDGGRGSAIAATVLGFAQFTAAVALVSAVVVAA